jgi:hypothetical protein
MMQKLGDTEQEIIPGARRARGAPVDRLSILDHDHDSGARLALTSSS